MNKLIIIGGVIVIIIILIIIYYFSSQKTTTSINPVIINSSNVVTFDPLSISGCSLWLDANDISTITLNNNNVSSWVDKSTNKFIFSQSNNVNQPIYDKNSVNNNSTISFVANNKNYLGGPTNFEIGTNSFALFMVFKFNDATSNGSIFNKSLYGGANGRILVVRENNGNFNMLVTDKVHLNNVFKDTYPSNKYRVLTLIFNRNSGMANIYQNSQLINSFVYNTIDNSSNLTNPYNMIIGAYNNTTGNINPPQDNYYLDGSIAEILAYSNNTDMTSLSQKQVENYLISKWNI